MNIATLVGLVVAILGLIGGFILEGGRPDMLGQYTAATIVFGGTIGAAFLSNSMSAMTAVPKGVIKAFREPKEDLRGIVREFVELAEKARREGLLSLEEEAQKIKDPFMRKGVLLVVDGTDPEVIEEVLATDVHAMKKRHEKVYAVFEQMGAFGPTMGIIGTVMGLVLVLSKLDKPDELGHKIAVAFIATLYGVMSANVFYLPIAAKLKGQSRSEAEVKEMITVGILSIQAGDNPRIVQEKLEAFLPDRLRGQATAKGKAPDKEERAAA